MDYSDTARQLAPALAGYFPAFGVDNVGTFAPTIVGSAVAGTFGYVLQNGYYTRIGGVVFFSALININAITIAPTGNLQVSLPLTAAASNAGSFAITDHDGFTLGAGYSQIGARVTPSTALALLVRSGSA